MNHPTFPAKLVSVGYGIKKLQIMMTIVDDLVSVDNLIEDHFDVEPANEYIQSCDIVAFNKICKLPTACLVLFFVFLVIFYVSLIVCPGLDVGKILNTDDGHLKSVLD
jgi:hypothetical protein